MPDIATINNDDSLAQIYELVGDQGTGHAAAHDRNPATNIFGKFPMASNLFAVYKPHRVTSSQI